MHLGLWGISRRRYRPCQRESFCGESAAELTEVKINPDRSWKLHRTISFGFVKCSTVLAKIRLKGVGICRIVLKHGMTAEAGARDLNPSLQIVPYIHWLRCPETSWRFAVAEWGKREQNAWRQTALRVTCLRLRELRSGRKKRYRSSAHGLNVTICRPSKWEGDGAFGASGYRFGWNTHGRATLEPISNRPSRTLQ